MIDDPRAHLIIRVDHSKWKYNHRGYNARQDGASNSPSCSLFLLYPSMFSESIEPYKERRPGGANDGSVYVHFSMQISPKLGCSVSAGEDLPISVNLQPARQGGKEGRIYYTQLGVHGYLTKKKT